jgi:hypothetical protein
MALLDFLFGGPSYSTVPNSPESAMQGASPNVLQRFGTGLDRATMIPGLPTPPMDEEERMRQRWMTLANIGSTLARGGTAAEGLQQARQQALQQQIVGAQFAQMMEQQKREQALRQALTAQPSAAQQFQAGQAAMAAEGAGPTVAAAQAQKQLTEASRPFASLSPEQRLIASQMPYAEAVKYIGENVKPEEYGTGTNTGMIGGRPVSYVVGKRGGIKVLDVSPQPNEEKIDTGNQILIVDKYTGKTVGTYGKQMTPGEAATNLRALSAQDLNERKFKFDQQQTAQQNVFRAQELGFRGQELQQGQQRLAQGDRELVTDASGNMFFVSKTGAPSTAISGPSGEALKGKGQTIPTAVTEEFVKNQANLNSIQDAYKLVEANPDAVGPLTGRTPAGIRDPFASEKNIQTRAAVARIGSMLIKDISGATVPVAEVPRLAPFIPLPTDDEKAIKVKLNELEKEIRNIEEERRKQYTAQGMNYPSLSGRVAIPGAPNIMNQYGLTPRK